MDTLRFDSCSVNGTNTVSFGYDNDGLLTQAGDLTLARDVLNGRLTGTTLGGVTDNWTFDGFGAAQSYTASAGGTALYSFSFLRDNVGRITNKTEAIAGVTNVFAYAYDTNRGWLTDVTSNGVATAHYDYDDNGNRTNYVSSAGTVVSVYDNQDRLLQSTTATYSYTANGELETKTSGGSTTTNIYDIQGNLRQITLPTGTAIEYIVDGTGRRIGKKINGTLTRGWLYQDGLKPIVELDGGGNVVTLFVYGGKANVPEYMVKGGTEYRLITDHLGSVRLVVSVTDGTIAERLDYDEFGRVLDDSNPGFQPFGYAGGLYDPDTGLVRFGARDFDAASGRWTCKDPIGFGGGGNWYGYVGGDPINAKDLLGLMNCAELKASINDIETRIHSAIKSGGDVNQMFGDAKGLAFVGLIGDLVMAADTGAGLYRDLGTASAETAATTFEEGGTIYTVSARGLIRARGSSTYRYTMGAARRAYQVEAGLAVAKMGANESGQDVANALASDVASHATDLPINFLNEAEAVAEKEMEMGEGMSDRNYETIGDLQATLELMMGVYTKCCGK